MELKDKDFKFSPAKMIVKKFGNRQELIGSHQQKSSYATSIEVDLKEGCEYLISGTFDWILWESYEGCLTVYGPAKVVFKNPN